MKIIKGDKIKIIAGKDKGREGEVVKSFPKSNSVVIEGLNIFKKHIKATKDTKGGIIEKERPLDVSKIALICPNCKKTTRVAYQIDKTGDKYRVCKKCKAILTNVSVKK